MILSTTPSMTEERGQDLGWSQGCYSRRDIFRDFFASIREIVGADQRI